MKGSVMHILAVWACLVLVALVAVKADWPTRDGDALNAFPRYLLEATPAFAVLGLLMEGEGWPRLRALLGCYPVCATALLSFALLQFLTGHWMV